MSDHSVQTPVRMAQATRSRTISAAAVWDMVSYWLVLVGVYFTVGAVFNYGGVEKLFSGSIAAPASVVKQFSTTWLGGGINFLWGVLGVLEFAVFLVLLASIVVGEFLPSHHKSLLQVGLGLALLTFACLSFGQTVSSNFAGAATQWSYVAGTGVLMLLVAMLPPNRPRAWISGGGHEHDEA